MPSSKQQKGYRSNSKVREWLLEHGFTYVYFHPHPAHADLVTISKGKEFYARDLFGLFDGMAIDTCGDLVLFQVKTNSWDGWKEIVKFTKGKSIKCILLNVIDRKGVKARFHNYPTTNDTRFTELDEAVVSAGNFNEDLMLAT